MSYDYTKKESLLKLKEDLSNIPLPLKAYLALMATQKNLMHYPLGLRASVALLSIRYGDNSVKTFAPVLAEKKPKFVFSMWDSIMDHMVHGHDTYDKRSAGGWSGPELGTFVRYADILGCLPVPSLVDVVPQEEEEATSGFKI